jgi:phosphoribosyl-AMP cyclohydrolase
MSAKIASKMAAAMKEIDAVTKKGRNENQKYSYVRAADVANEVRHALVNQGIAFTYDVSECRNWEKASNSGSMLNYCHIKVDCLFIDSESGESVTAGAVGWGMDSGDKAPYKAMTGALKYIMRMTFLIPDESDPENEKEESPRMQIVKPQPPPKNLKAALTESNEFITEEQRQFFIETATKRGKSKNDIVSALNQAGIKKTDQIPSESYDSWIDWCAQ